MEFRLKNHQKELLVDLFNDSQIDTSHLFSSIECNLKSIDIPTEGNQVAAVNAAMLMLEISQASNKLKKLLSRLSENEKQPINFLIANQILEQYSKVETIKYYEKSDAIKITARLSEYSDFRHHFIKGRYGNGKWDRVVDAICHSWPIELATERNITLKCNLVQFFSIILDEDSHEKILKFIKRSSWYEQHFYLDTTWQNNS